MKKLNDYLVALGLTEIEAKIYRGLLESGTTSITDLSHKLEMNRITAYFNIKNLINKGLITHIKQGRKRQLSAEPPARLKDLLEVQTKRVQDLEENFPLILQSFNELLPKTHQKKTEVKHFVGKRSVKQIYNEVLQAKEIRSYVTSQLDALFPENEALFSQTHHKRKNMYIWEILDNSPINDTYTKKMQSDRYFHKLMPKKLEIVDYLIYDGKVAIIDIEKGEENNVVGVVIENEHFYKSSQSIFEFMWSVLPEIQKKSDK